MPWYRQLHWQIMLGLAAGLLFGILAAAQGWSRFTDLWIAPFGTIFLNSLKLIAMPLVLTSLIGGVASLSDVKKLSRIGGRTIAIYIATTVVAVTIGLVFVNVLRPGDQIPEDVRAELQATYAGDVTAGAAAAGELAQRGPLQTLVDIVPANFFGAASSNQNMLQVVFVALFLGVGLIQVPTKTGKPLLDVFEGLSAVVIRLVDLIMFIAPLGVFALIANTITTVAGDDLGRVLDLLGALGFYCLVVILGLATHIGVTYVVLLKVFSPMKIRTFFAGIAPAQLVAFSTSSSGATLPVTMERCEE